LDVVGVAHQRGAEFGVEVGALVLHDLRARLRRDELGRALHHRARIARRLDRRDVVRIARRGLAADPVRLPARRGGELAVLHAEVRRTLAAELEHGSSPYEPASGWA